MKKRSLIFLLLCMNITQSYSQQSPEQLLKKAADLISMG